MVVHTYPKSVGDVLRREVLSIDPGCYQEKAPLVVGRSFPGSPIANVREELLLRLAARVGCVVGEGELLSDG